MSEKFHVLLHRDQVGSTSTPSLSKRMLGVFFNLFAFLNSSSTTRSRLYRGRVPRLTSDNLRAATHETERGDHDFCLRWSYYTDTDPSSRERAATAGIEPKTSSPGAARSTDSATAQKGASRLEREPNSEPIK